jgi:Flagellar hook-length control protein FliK
MKIPCDIPGRSLATHSHERVGRTPDLHERVGGESDTIGDQNNGKQSSCRVQRAATNSYEANDGASCLNGIDASDGSQSKTQCFSSFFRRMESRCKAIVDGEADTNEAEHENSNASSFGRGEGICANIFSVLIAEPMRSIQSDCIEEPDSKLIPAASSNSLSEDYSVQWCQTSQDRETQGSQRLVRLPMTHVAGNEKPEKSTSSAVVIPFVGAAAERSKEQLGIAQERAVQSLSESDIGNWSALQSGTQAAGGGSLYPSTPENLRYTKFQRQVDLQDELDDPGARDIGNGIGKYDGKDSVPNLSTISEFRTEFQVVQSDLAAPSQMSAEPSSHGASMTSPTHQISESIRRSVGSFPTAQFDHAGGAKTLHVKLQPDGLGEVQLSFRFRGDKAKIHLSSSKAATRDILQLDSGSLIAEIKKIAPSLELVDVSFSVNAGEFENGRYDSFAGVEDTLNSKWTDGLAASGFGAGGLGKNTGENAQGWPVAPSPKQTNDPEMGENGMANVVLRSNSRGVGDAIYL